MLILTLFFLATDGTVFGEEMAKEGAFIGKNYLSGTSKVLVMGKKMIKQIDKYWDKLFTAPITVYTPTGEITIRPQRTNNIVECFF